MAYQIKLQSSGHVFEAEEGELILDAALKQGISFPYGCRSGVCCTCLGQVVSGTVDYPNGLPMGLPEEDHEAGQALFCQAAARSDLVLDVAEIDSVDMLEIQTLPAKVVSLRKLAPDVMEMQLKLPETSRLQYYAGQYIEIILPDGKRRAFSIANAPTNDQVLELHLRHVPGGHFTEQVFNELQEKAILRIEGPLGSFFIRDDSDAPIIMLGGGTGFAPLKSMVEQLVEEGNKRPIHLYWGARAKVDLYQLALAEKWQAYGYVTFVPVLSDPAEDDAWQGRTGYVHTAVAEDFADLSGFDVYMSGPPPMIDAAKVAFTAQGLPSDNIFSDAFDYSADALSAMADGS